MRNFVAYFDESGTKELMDLSQNLYSITAVVLPEDSCSKYEIELKKIMEIYFGDNLPELKANWMRVESERKSHYLDPYNLTESIFKNFVDKFYASFSQMDDIKILSSVINKDLLIKSYKNPFNPNALAYEFLVQRLANFSTQYDCNYIFYYDEFPEGKTKAGNKWEDLLAKQHKGLKKGYSEIYKHWLARDSMNYSSLPEEIIFLNSKDRLFLQLADISGYNIKRQTELFFNHKKKNRYWGYDKIRARIHHSPVTNKVKNFGVVIYPESIIVRK
jgi:hypothetical protein